MISSNENSAEIKWILGTATFQSGYGVANQGSNQKNRDPIKILERAESQGIESIDTAPTYGQAEEIVGQFHKFGKKFSCFTKISSQDVSEALSSVKNSLRNLGIEKLKGVYFHNQEELLLANVSHIQRLIGELREYELTESIGVSVYTEQEIIRVNEKFPEINLFQVPENILDRRLINSPVVENLAGNGYTFHVRSIFLQGLLLLPPEQLPNRFNSIYPHLKDLKLCAESLDTNVHNLCINFIGSIPWASGVVIGAATPEQLQETVRFSRIEIDRNLLPKALPVEYSDPRKW